MDALHALDAAGSGVAVQRLPFTVRVVRHEPQLRKAVAIRQRAYERHLPALGEAPRAGLH